MPHLHDSINMCVHILVCVKHVHIHVCPPVSAGFAFMNLNRYKSKVFFLENSFIMNTQVLFLLFPTQYSTTVIGMTLTVYSVLKLL